MRQTFGTTDTHAIVMGGSMAGLLAARVLTEHVATVTLIERDTLSPCAASRRGTPQDRHTHGLLASGRQVLDDLFPGFSWDAADQGAIRCDVLRDARWHFEGGNLARPMSGLRGLMASRPFLEAAVRARVLRLPNLTLRGGSQVSGLTARAWATASLAFGSPMAQSSPQISSSTPRGAGRGRLSGSRTSAMTRPRKSGSASTSRTPPAGSGAGPST